jgi:hypothetical protein
MDISHILSGTAGKQNGMKALVVSVAVVPHLVARHTGFCCSVGLEGKASQGLLTVDEASFYGLRPGVPYGGSFVRITECSSQEVLRNHLLNEPTNV